MSALARPALRWAATFVAFPVGGLLARLTGPLDSVPAGLLGGALVGAAVGVAQVLAAGGSDRPPRTSWVLTSVVGGAVGVAVGGAAVGWSTTVGDLVAQGLLGGALLGLAQAVVAARRWGPRALAWVPMTALAWAAGWATTASVGVDVERQYAVFGSTGALVATLLTGLVAVPALRAAQGRRSAVAS